MKRKKKITPTRKALVATSSLRPSVVDGIGAMKKADRKLLDSKVRSAFSDSLDLDMALQPKHPQQNRWDYLLGHEPSGEVVGLEPHSAKQDEVSTVIRKRTAALEQLVGHLRDGKKVAEWYWVASGKIQFADIEKTAVRLAENGIKWVGPRLLERHLPSAPKERKGRTRK